MVNVTKVTSSIWDRLDEATSYFFHSSTQNVSEYTNLTGSESHRTNEAIEGSNTMKDKEEFEDMGEIIHYI